LITELRGPEMKDRRSDLYSLSSRLWKRVQELEGGDVVDNLLAVLRRIEGQDDAEAQAVIAAKAVERYGG
jgi:hypothetical protein